MAQRTPEAGLPRPRLRKLLGSTVFREGLYWLSHQAHPAQYSRENPTKPLRAPQAAMLTVLQMRDGELVVRGPARLPNDVSTIDEQNLLLRAMRRNLVTHSRSGGRLVAFVTAGIDRIFQDHQRAMPPPTLAELRFQASPARQPASYPVLGATLGPRMTHSNYRTSNMLAMYRTEQPVPEAALIEAAHPLSGAVTWPALGELGYGSTYMTYERPIFGRHPNRLYPQNCRVNLGELYRSPIPAGDLAELITELPAAPPPQLDVLGVGHVAVAAEL